MTITRPMCGALALLAPFLAACSTQAPPRDAAGASGPHAAIRILDPDPREKHFGPLRMLTDGGENAEAYFSFDGGELIFQSTRPPHACDQIFTMTVDGARQRLVSTGRGRTTCAYYLPGDRRVIYSSTHAGGDSCPPPADMNQGYTWALYPEYDIYVANADGSDPRPLFASPGYDAEATVSPKGDRIVFTSTRDGDLELYSMNIDGSDVRRLTHEPGYDGGAFFSPDGTKIVYRANHPSTPEQLEDYRRLLAKNLIRPSRLEIFVMDADGSNKKQVTSLGAASFGPFFHPSGKRIVFSSNYPNPRGREFELWMVDIDGRNLEQVTYSPEFDGFPMFSPDGKRFVFCSNRSNSKPNETNVYITEWKD